jgi:hypothetical protein
MKKVTILGVLFVIVCLFVSSSFALDPMGPPAAGLRQGGWSIGIDYSTSKINGKEDRQWWSSSRKFKGASMDKIYANLGYGVADNWEVYGRLGGSKLESDNLYYGNIWGAYGQAYGLGTKATIYQEGNVKWGVLFQIGWNQTKDQSSEDFYDKAAWHEYQIAVGPTYKLTDKVSIYGGPFYNYLKGTLSDRDNGEEIDGHFKGSNHVGGYIGGQFAVNDNLSLNAEYQLVTDAQGLGLSLVWKF